MSTDSNDASPFQRRVNIIVGDLPAPLLEGASGENMEDGPYRVLAFAGFFIIAGIAWAVGSRARPNGKTLLGSLVLIWLIGGVDSRTRS